MESIHGYLNGLLFQEKSEVKEIREELSEHDEERLLSKKMIAVESSV